MALRVDRFRELNEFKADMDDMLQALRAAEKIEGEERIYTHGEKEHYLERDRLENGIPYHPNFVERLRSLGEEFEVPFGY